MRVWNTTLRLVLALVAGLFFVSAALAEDPTKLPKPVDTFVTDLANVIDASSVASIDRYCQQLHDKTGTTLEVVTIKSLDGAAIEDFASQLKDTWHPGKKGEDKWLLMIFSIADHKRRIEVGYGLEGILNDAKTGDIGRSMVDQLKAGQYGPAILSGVQQLGSVIAADANVTLDDAAAPAHTYHYQQTSRSHSGRGGWVGIVVFIVIILIFARGGGGGGGWMWFLLGSMMGGGGRGGGDGGSFGGGGDGGSSGGGDFGGGDGGGGGSSGDW